MQDGLKNGDDNKVEKCKWYQEPFLRPVGYCYVGNCPVDCDGDVYDCECGQRRLAEEKTDTIDRRAEEEREGK